MAYCTASDVALYINIEQVSDIDSIIEAAMNKVDIFTKDIFETRTITVYTEASRAMTAELPYTTQSISSIVALPSGISVPENLWDVEIGAISRIRFYAIAPYNFLVVGAEPYSDRYKQELRVNATGVFGSITTPFEIKTATALIAAYYIALSGQGRLTENATSFIGAQPDISSLEVEGYKVSYRAPSEDTFADSTGIVAIDRMLSPFKRTKRLRAN
jgi:hypothetical protein